MSWTDAPAILTQLRTQLLATTAYTGAEATVHYPRAEFSSSASLYAELAVTGRSVDRRFTDVNLPTGTLEIVIWSTGTVGALETMAQSIGDQICTATGIENLQVTDISEAEESDEAETAGVGNLAKIVITLSWGLE